MTLEQSARWGQVVLAAVALFAALQVASDLFAPLALALVLGVVLSPISTGLERLGAGKFISSLAVLVFSLCALGAFLLFIGPYLTRLWVEAPVIWRELRLSFLELQQVIQGLSDASEEVAKAIDGGNGESAKDDGGASAVPSFTDAVLAAPAFMAQLLIFIGTLFFFVLAREDVYRWLAYALEGPDSIMAQRLQQADRMVSRYFLTISLINLGFGICVGTGLWLIGLPSPVLWGVLAALMNFILYLGPALVALALLIAGIVVFDGFELALPPLVFVGLNILEGQFITPLLVGRHISVNPLLVFLSLVFWLWLWGPIGGIVAIPLLIWCLSLTGRMGDMATAPASARPAAAT